MTVLSEHQQMYKEIMAKAWSDPDYQVRLKSDPHSAFAEMGLKIPENININVFENTADTYNFVIHKPPVEGVLSDEDMDNVIGGSGLVISVYLTC